MSLSQLIAGKGKNRSIATATVATNATHWQQEGQNVANVAVVAVANPYDRQSALPANDHDHQHEQKPEPVLCIACQHYRFGHDYMGNVARCMASGGFRGVLVERPERRRECRYYALYAEPDKP